MVSVSLKSDRVVTDEWVQASWDEFMSAAANPTWEAGSFYYFDRQMRIEIAPVGYWQARGRAIVSQVASLFATFADIAVQELCRCSFRLEGVCEFQPDISFYLGARSDFAFPARGDDPVDLSEIQPPSLAIEVAASSLDDDLGWKRLLYEQAGVLEYWVVDVMRGEVIAFEMSEGRSGRIYESLVLPGLRISLLEEVLRRSQTEDDGAVNRWLMETFVLSSK